MSNKNRDDVGNGPYNNNIYPNVVLPDATEAFSLSTSVDVFQNINNSNVSLNLPSLSNSSNSSTDSLTTPLLPYATNNDSLGNKRNSLLTESLSLRLRPKQNKDGLNNFISIDGESSNLTDSVNDDKDNRNYTLNINIVKPITIESPKSFKISSIESVPLSPSLGIRNGIRSIGKRGSDPDHQWTATFTEVDNKLIENKGYISGGKGNLIDIIDSNSSSEDEIDDKSGFDGSKFLYNGNGPKVISTSTLTNEEMEEMNDENSNSNYVIKNQDKLQVSSNNNNELICTTTNGLAESSVTVNYFEEGRSLSVIVNSQNDIIREIITTTTKTKNTNNGNNGNSLNQTSIQIFIKTTKKVIFFDSFNPRNWNIGTIYILLSTLFYCFVEVVLKLLTTSSSIVIPLNEIAFLKAVVGNILCFLQVYSSYNRYNIILDNKNISNLENGGNNILQSNSCVLTEEEEEEEEENDDDSIKNNLSLKDNIQFKERSVWECGGIFGYEDVRKILVIRCLLGYLSMILGWYSLMLLSLAEFTVLRFLSPVFTTLLAYYFIGETFGLSEIFVGIMSVIGTLLISCPDLIDSIFKSIINFNLQTVTMENAPFQGDKKKHVLGVVCVVLSGLLSSIVTLILRYIAPRTSHMHSVIYFSMISLPLSFIFGIIKDEKWVLPTHLITYVLLFFASFLGYLAHILATMGLQRVTATKASSISYIQVVFAFIAEWLVWGILPSVHTLLGGIIICGSMLVSSFIIAPKNENIAEISAEAALDIDSAQVIAE